MPLVSRMGGKRTLGVVHSAAVGAAEGVLLGVGAAAASVASRGAASLNLFRGVVGSTVRTSSANMITRAMMKAAASLGVATARVTGSIKPRPPSMALPPSPTRYDAAGEQIGPVVAP